MILDPQSWLKIVVKRRGRVLAASVVLTALAAPGLLELRLDNSPRVFFVNDAEALQRYRQFEMDFGRDWVVRLAASGPGLWTDEGLRWLAEVEMAAASLGGSAGAAGLYTRHRSDFDVWPPEPDSLRRRALDDPLDRNAGWVGRQGETVSLLIALYHLDRMELDSLLDELERAAGQAPPGVEAWIAGLPSIQRAMDRELIRFFSRFFPLLGVLAVILLLVVLGRPVHVLPPLMLVAVCTTLLFGGMGFVGVTLNLVTMMLAPLIFVITLATAVHVLVRVRYHQQQGESPPRAVCIAYREKAWPVFWTGVTTGVGFGALVSSTVPPVRTLGACAAAGIALMTVAAFTFYPALLALGRVSSPASRPVPRPLELWARRAGRGVAQWAGRRHRMVFMGSAAVALVCLPGVGLLTTETSVLSYLPRSHPARQAIERLEGAGIGAVSAELTLAAKHEDGAPFEQPGQLLRLADATRELRQLPLVLGAVSAGDLLEDVLQRQSAATPEEALARPGLASPEQRLLPYFWTRDGRRARISLLVPLAGHRELDPVLERARGRVEALFPDLQAAVTGRYPLVLAAQRRLLETMMASLSITLLVVTLIFAGLLRRLPLWLAALAPNGWAVLFVLGAMGWAGVPLDSTTIMIASVVLGLAVDDTLHTFGHYRRLASRLDPARAAVRAVEEVAGAHVLSTLLLAGGFLVCALSSFVPVARFGALAAAALMVALLADLLLVPAWLSRLPTNTTRAA